MENTYMLDAFKMEQKRWPNLENLNESVDTNFLLPQTVLNFGEYQNKLQSLAFYAE